VPEHRRHWLAATPRLLAAYYAVGNRWRRRTGRDRRFVAALIALWVCAVTLLARVSLPALIAAGQWCSNHGLTLDAAAFGIALVLVSRRRAVVRADAARSWLAALGSARGPAFLEARLLELTPALLLLAALTLACVSLLGVAGFREVGAWQGLASTAGSLAVAVLLGALSSYLIPPGRDEDLPPGSRYVPHRRRRGPPLPRASLAGLGRWPTRRLFATLRPKVVVRAIVPVLFAVPLGTNADAALLLLGVVAASGALMLLLVSLHAVGRCSYRWLQPVPLRLAVLRRALLGRTFLALAALTGVWGDLVWVAGMPLRDAWQRSLALWALCTALAVGLSWLATRRRSAP